VAAEFRRLVAAPQDTVPGNEPLALPVM